MPREGTAAYLNEAPARAEKPGPVQLQGVRKDIVLASSSPRRIRMFRERGYDVRVQPADIDETLPFTMPAETAVMYLSLAKALHVAKKARGLIIAADTVVVCDGEIIGKPKNEEEAFDVLSRLRGRAHQVITGVCLVDNGEEAAGKEGPAGAGSSEADSEAVAGAPADEPAQSVRGSAQSVHDSAQSVRDSAQSVRKRCLCDVTDVYFGDYSDEELRAYVQTPEPYDKAGGYAIQETFGKYIDRIQGDMDNVIGFPMYRVEPYLNGESI